MATLTKSRRRHRRHEIAAEQKASVEFAQAGRTRSFPIHNLSASGVSFAARDAGDFASLESGLGLGEAVIRLGKVAIRGELLVMHVSGDGAEQICGALFYPATDGDLVTLNGVVERMDSARNK